MLRFVLFILSVDGGRRIRAQIHPFRVWIHRCSLGLERGRGGGSMAVGSGSEGELWALEWVRVKGWG